MRPPASSTAAATASGRASVKYKYQTIKEAYDLVMSSDVQQKVVNLYCVVMECSNIRNTRGTDKVCNLKVADSSTSEMGYSEGVELVCFAPSADLMPTVERPGDIIRMHRVRIGEWNGSPQLVGKLASTKWQPFHYVLFHGKVGPGTFVAESEAFVPYKSSSANFTFCPVEDKRQVGMLRGDVAPEALQAATTAVASGANDFTRRIDQLHSLNDEGKRNVDILCKVLTITDRGAMDSLFFGVWDGTVAMAESIADCDDTGAISDAHPEVNDLLGQSYVSDMWFSEEYLKQITDENFGADPKRGTILPVVVPHSLRDSVKAINPKEKPWVTFRNVRVTFHMGQYYALYTRISRWAVHAASEEEAAPSGEAETLAALRVAASPTTTTHPNAPITPLRQLLCSKGDAKPNYYRVLARMIGYAPTEDEWQEVSPLRPHQRHHHLLVLLREREREQHLLGGRGVPTTSMDVSVSLRTRSLPFGKTD